MEEKEKIRVATIDSAAVIAARMAGKDGEKTWQILDSTEYRYAFARETPDKAWTIFVSKDVNCPGPKGIGAC